MAKLYARAVQSKALGQAPLQGSLAMAFGRTGFAQVAAFTGKAVPREAEELHGAVFILRTAEKHAAPRMSLSVTPRVLLAMRRAKNTVVSTDLWPT